MSLNCKLCKNFPFRLFRIAILLIVAFALLLRSYIAHNKKSKEVKADDSLTRAESSSVQGVIHESASNIANVVKRTNKKIGTN